MTNPSFRGNPAYLRALLDRSSTDRALRYKILQGLPKLHQAASGAIQLVQITPRMSVLRPVYCALIILV